MFKCADLLARESELQSREVGVLRELTTWGG
jgi:hypothetical protein